MRYWWVNQNQTYRAEIGGGYIWSPKRNRNGYRNQFYEYMREVSPGDQIFSFFNRKVGAVGLAVSNCYEAPQSGEFGTTGLLRWEKVGWRVDVAYTLCDQAVTPKEHIDRIRPFLPQKYTPLQRNGNGLQSVYLAEISEGLAGLLTRLLEQAGNDPVVETVPASDSEADTARTDADSAIASEMRKSTTITDTDKENWSSRDGVKDVSGRTSSNSRTGAACLGSLMSAFSSPVTSSHGAHRRTTNDWMVRTVYCCRQTSTSSSTGAFFLSRMTGSYSCHPSQTRGCWGGLESASTRT